MPSVCDDRKTGQGVVAGNEAWGVCDAGRPGNGHLREEALV